LSIFRCVLGVSTNFFIASSLSLHKDSVNIPANGQTILSVSGNSIFVAPQPEYFAGTAGGTNVFGNTGLYVLNFTSSGTVVVSNPKSYAQVFDYYIFPTKFNNQYCSSIDIVIEPQSGFYYGARKKGLSTTYSYNETMANSFTRCFYFIMNAEYYATFTTSNIESYDHLNYSTSSNLYSKVSSVSTIVYPDDHLSALWKTDSTILRGYAGFRLTKTGSSSTYSFKRPTTANMLCVSTYYCNWKTSNTLAPPDNDYSSSSSSYDDEMSDFSSTIITIVCVTLGFFVIVIIIICCFCSQIFKCLCYPHGTETQQPEVQHTDNSKVIIIQADAPAPGVQYAQPPPQVVGTQPQPYMVPAQPQYMTTPQQPYMVPPQQPVMAPAPQPYMAPAPQPYMAPPQQPVAPQLYMEPPTEPNPYQSV